MKAWTSTLKQTKLLQKTGLKKIILSFAAALILARISFPSGLMPFGPAILAYSFLAGGRAFAGAVFSGCAAGCLLSVSEEKFAYLAVILLVTGVTLIIRRIKCKKEIPVYFALLASSAVTAVVFYPGDIHRLFIFSFGGVFSCFACYIASAVYGCGETKENKTALNILLACVFAFGLRGIYLFDVSVGLVVIITSGIMVSFVSDGITGGSFCAAAGLGYSLLGEDLYIVPLLFLSGFCCGLLKKNNKYYAAAVFSLISFLLLFCFSPKGEHEYIAEFCAAPLIFLLLPKKLSMAFENAFGTLSAEDRLYDEQRIMDSVCAKINGMSKVICDIAQVFSSRHEMSADNDSVYKSICERACSGCVFFDACWKDKERMLREIDFAYDSFVKSGMCVLSDTLKKRCVKEYRMKSVMESVFFVCDMKRKYLSKSAYIKKTVKEQLLGAADVISSLKNDIFTEAGFDRKSEKDIRDMLVMAGIKNVFVDIRRNNGDIMLTARHKACGGKHRCVMIKKIAEEYFNTGMQILPALCPPCGSTCTVRLSKRRKYNIKAYGCSIKKDGSNACGDRFICGGLADERCMLLLCDGMGSGEKANERASSALLLAKSFFEAGVGDMHAIKSINKLLVLSSSDDTYSTMDICLIDKNAGYADFIKIGCPRSFIVRGENVIEISDGALPIGIVDEIKPNTVRLRIKNGDRIVMFSDGIADLAVDLKNFVKNCVYMNSEKKAVQEMTDMAIEISGGAAKDDITAIVAGVYFN